MSLESTQKETRQKLLEQGRCRVKVDTTTNSIFKLIYTFKLELKADTTTNSIVELITSCLQRVQTR
jgi:hypothetical protein